MTSKAYIVANEQQEHEVLEKLEYEGLRWIGGKYLPSNSYYIEFPYVIFKRDKICWGYLEDLRDEEIIYDGRKEEHMSEKYVVSQEFMDELKEWKAGLNINGQYYVSDEDIFDTPVVIEDWWKDDTHALEQNNRLIAIIRWVNGEDVFEVEKPKKWLIRSKDCTEQGNHLYVMLDISHGVKKTINFWDKDVATRFDTKEEAESWANSHQEVRELIEVKE